VFGLVHPARVRSLRPIPLSPRRKARAHPNPPRSRSTPSFQRGWDGHPLCHVMAAPSPELPHVPQSGLPSNAFSMAMVTRSPRDSMFCFLPPQVIHPLISSLHLPSRFGLKLRPNVGLLSSGRPVIRFSWSLPLDFFPAVLSLPSRSHDHALESATYGKTPVPALYLMFRDEDLAPLPGTRSHAKKKPVSYIPRPKNAFTIFHPMYSKRNSTPPKAGAADSPHAQKITDHRTLTKAAGDAWQRMTEEEKAPCRELVLFWSGFPRSSFRRAGSHQESCGDQSVGYSFSSCASDSSPTPFQPSLFPDRRVFAYPDAIGGFSPDRSPDSSVSML